MAAKTLHLGWVMLHDLRATPEWTSMPNVNDPDALRSLLLQMEAIVRRAYSDGHRQGTQDTTDRLVRAVSGGVDARLQVMPSTPGVQSSTLNGDVRMSPPRAGLGDASRQYRYGSVIGMVREALIEGAGVGISPQQLLAYCRSRGVDVTPNVIRETIKRLRGNEEIERRDGLYFAGPRLVGYTPETLKTAVAEPGDLLFMGNRR